MKENAIKNLNIMGKVGRIITTVVMVVIGIILVGCIIGTIGFSLVPKDALQINAHTVAEVNVNSIIDNRFVKMDWEDLIQDEDMGLTGSLTYNGDELTIVSVDEDGLIHLESSEPFEFNMGRVKASFIAGIVAMACAYIAARFFKLLCKKLETCTTPFSDDIIKNMKYFAFSLIPFVGLASVRSFMTERIWNPSLDYNFNASIPAIVLIAVVFVLIQIFKYGACLQQESDETI